MALTSEHIVTAVNDLRKRGQTPTVRAIRDCLGTGSLGTISRLLREIPSHPPSNGEGTELPSELLRVLSSAFDRKAREIRDTIGEERRAEQAQLGDLEEENLRLENRIGELTRKETLLAEEVQKGEGRIQEIRSLCDSRERALEREREERIRAEKHASSLEGEQKAVLEQTRDLRERLAEAQCRIETLLQEKAAGLSDLRSLPDKGATSRNRNSSLRAQRGQDE
ncbi:MAG: DNA-binding protein [Leptospirales bacterium]